MKISTFTKIILFFILVAFSDFFSFYKLKPYFQNIRWAIIALIFFSLFLNSKDIFNNPSFRIRKFIILFAMFPFISFFPAYFVHGQSFYLSLKMYSTLFPTFIIYFYLLKQRIDERTLMNIIFIFTAIYVFIEYFQQITYPNYWFAGRQELKLTRTLEVRLGMYRFYIMGIHLVILATLYSWEKLIYSYGKKWLLLFLMGMIGVYGFLARKFDFVLIFVLVLSIFIGKKIRWYVWAFIIILSSMVFFYSNLIFGDFIERSNNEIRNKNFTRYESMYFYLNYFDDPSTIWLGNGLAHKESGYGRYIDRMEKVYNLYRIDIGVFAHYNLYGIFGFIPIIFFIIFIIHEWEKLRLFIKLYFIFTVILMPIAFPLNSVYGVLTFTIILYLIELNLLNNKSGMVNIKTFTT